MQSLARQNGRVKDAAYHYVLSWQSSESPTNHQALDAMTATLSALDMHDHQWIGAVHRNTGHVHVHVAVSRINPRTRKSVYPKGDWIALDRACRGLELKHGWKHNPGPHSVEVGGNHGVQVVRNQRNLNYGTPPPPTTKARNFAAWNGVESFQEWVGKAPAESLKLALAKPGALWQDVHQSLHAFNLEYRTKGSGAIVVDRDMPGKLHAKASHLGRFASLGQIVTRLGPFQPPRYERPQLHSENHTPNPTTIESYARDTKDCKRSRALRASDLKALFERYAAVKSQWRATELPQREHEWRRQRDGEQARVEQLRQEIRATRERVKLTPANKNRRVLYSIQAFATAAKRETLQLQIQEERRKLRSAQNRRKLKTFRQWLSCKLGDGDPIASAMMRGVRYRDRKGKHDVFFDSEIGAVTGQDAPRKATLSGLNWVADRNGVSYRCEKKTIFRDEGQRVVFYDMGDENIRAGILLCREKWTRGICLAGTDEFRAKIRTIAAELNVRILESERAPTPFLNSPQHFESASVTHRDFGANVLDLNLITRSLGKPIFAAKPKNGHQHTGRVVATGADDKGEGIVVIDVGRDLTVVGTDARTADKMRSELGRWTTARVNVAGVNSENRLWRFVSRSRDEPELRRAP